MRVSNDKIKGTDRKNSNYPNWEKRLGLRQNDLLVSPSFKLTKHGNEIYLASREAKSYKLSLHSSRIHRMADITDAPREPFLASSLGDIPRGEFRTIIRIVYTSETSILPEFPTDKIKKWLPLDFNHRLESVEYTIGYTSHHPDEHSNTKRSSHIFTGQVSDNKFITVTENRHRRSKALELALPRVGGSININRMITPINSYNLIVYSSDKFTYTYWIHCGIEPENRDNWWKKSLLFHTLTQIDPNFLKVMLGLISGKKEVYQASSE